MDSKKKSKGHKKHKNLRFHSREPLINVDFSCQCCSCGYKWTQNTLIYQHAKDEGCPKCNHKYYKAENPLFGVAPVVEGGEQLSLEGAENNE